jgi:hypothetical protein
MPAEYAARQQDNRDLGLGARPAEPPPGVVPPVGSAIHEPGGTDEEDYQVKQQMIIDLGLDVTPRRLPDSASVP